MVVDQVEAARYSRTSSTLQQDLQHVTAGPVWAGLRARSSVGKAFAEGGAGTEARPYRSVRMALGTGRVLRSMLS